FGCGGSKDPSNNNTVWTDGSVDCDPGSFLGCDGQDLILCNVEGSGSTRVPCGLLGCDAERQRCNQCDRNEPESCEGDLRVECSSEGIEIATELCPWGCTEGSGTATCNECRPEAIECHDATELVTCDGDGQITATQDCQFGCAMEEGRCNECAPLTVSCIGDELTACDPDGLVEQSEHCEQGCNAEALQCQCVSDTCLDEFTLLRCGAGGLPSGAELCVNGCTEGTGGGRCNECFPGSVLCDGQDVVTCGTDGLVASVMSCSMGCNSWEVPGRCLTFVPRYVDAASLEMGQEDFNPTCNVIIDTTARTIQCTTGNPPQAWTPPSLIVLQTYGPDLWVIHFRNVTIGTPRSVRVVGSRGLALVAAGAVTIQGVLDASARGATPGAGGRYSGSSAWTGPGTSPDGLVGAALPGAVCEFQRPSGGGGGHAGAGGNGGGTFTGADTIAGGVGGAAIGSQQLQPIYGGGRGNGTEVTQSGAGGGVLIITARDSITLSVTPSPLGDLLGRCDASGGGGQSSGAGGGAGGSLFLEAPTIQVGGWIRAVGGGGACGSGAGTDGYGSGNGCEPSGSGARGGDGGYSDDRPTISTGSNGTLGLCNTTTGYTAGGGGGGAGRARFRVATQPGNLTVGTGAILKFLPCGGTQAECVDVFTPF
ncbi:MAG: hypothetical protein RBU30_12510, partial [Polyangia bacterium]|nr:hypothetical protein [Polyangia bacterium]